MEPPFEEYSSLPKVKDLSRHYHKEVKPVISSWTSEMDQITGEGINDKGETITLKGGEIMRHIIAHEIHHISQLSIWARGIGKVPVTANLIGRGLFVNYKEEICPMSRYVIGPDVAIQLSCDEAVIRDEHEVLAPTLMRSQVLSRLYHAVYRSEMTRKEAERRLKYIRGLRIRLLGDRVLQSTAWKVADMLGWPDTLNAEYVALTQLQADAFITLNRELAHAAKGLVAVAPIEALF